MFPSLRDEFRLKMFGFNGVTGERLCYSQWRMPVALYLAYRFLLMAYAVFWLGFNSVHRGSPPQPWGAYLTIWTYILLTVYLIGHFLAAVLYHAATLCRQSSVVRVSSYLFARPGLAAHARLFPELGHNTLTMDDYEAIPGSEDDDARVTPPAGPPLYLCVVWVLFGAVSSAALMVSIVFFVFLFPELEDYPHINVENLQEHLLNSVIVLLEHLVSAAPYRLLHVVYPFAYGLVYMGFSLVYWATDHQHVMYPILDWNKPAPTVGYVFMVGFVFIPTLHLCFFAVHKLKLVVYRRVGCGDGDL